MNAKNLLNYNFALLIFFTAFASCKKKGIDSPQPQPVETSTVDVYAAGRINYVATYWKNGKAVTLGSAGSDANGMALLGKDVYVVGSQSTGNGNSIAKYWKNGVGVNLTDGTNYAMATDIFIVGNDVYIAGAEAKSGNTNYAAKYWKNGTPVTLTNDINARASGIAVVNNDVYIIGQRSPDGTSSIVCYWKNGQLFDLTDRNTYATDQAITVSGNDIYMSWSATYNLYGKLQTSYSKNFGTPLTIV
ncbi:MAG: hypothetical protein EOO91_17935, partial [Pedobacter sp.]